jgi:uncharacterized protein (TIGR02118 family)
MAVRASCASTFLEVLMSVSRITFLAAGAAAALSAGSASAAAMGDATLLALYKKPTDPAAFDSYYSKHHAPLAKTLPGLQSFTVSKGLTDIDPYYQVATLKFASVDAIKSAVGSTQGAAVVADLKNFAQAGVEIMIFENEPE